MNKRFHILFLLSLLSFGLSIYIYNSRNLTDKQSLKKDYFSIVQKNLDNKTTQVKNEIERAKEHLIAGDIKQFTSENTIFYISNGVILHWTDYHSPYKESFAAGNEPWKIVKTSQGVFLIYKQDIVSHNSVEQLIGVIDLYRDYQLSSSYLQTGYSTEIFEDYKIHRKSILDKNGQFLIVDGINLWKIDIDIDKQRTLSILVLWLGLLIISFVGTVIYIGQILKFLNNKGYKLLSVVFLASALLSFRYLMYLTKFPQNYFNFKLFDPKIFASSQINGSFGDLFLNIGCVLILVLYAYNWLMQFNVYNRLMHLKNKKSGVLTFVFIFLSFIVSLSVYGIFFNVYSNSQVNFDITESLHFDEPEAIYLIIFVCLIALYFTVNHFVLRAINILNHRHLKKLLIHIVAQIVLFVFIEDYYFNISWWLPLITGLYLIICVVFSLFTDFKKLQYKSYLYLTFCALICSLIISFTITRISEQKDFIQKTKFADQLILHNDIQGEYMMSEIAKRILKDEEIIQNLKNGFVAKEKIEKKVKERYFSNYFDKYEIHFSYFNNKGKAYYKNELIGDLDQIKSVYQLEKQATWLPNLYFITNFKKDFFSKYYHFVEVTHNREVVGTIVIDYTLKKYIAKSILPGLLQLSSVEGYKNIDDYNYAIFADNELQYSVGEFNYSSETFRPFLFNQNQYSQNLLIDDYHHLILTGADNKIIVVSSQDLKIYKILTNFSFHFLVLVLVTLLFLLSNAIRYFSMNKNNDFSTKIQTYLNAATFAPMIFLSVLILGLIATSYRKDQEIKFKNNAEILSSHVLGYLDEYKEKEIDLFEFKKSIDRLSKYSGTDINIYGLNGRLLLSNQPLLYESGVISNLINPSASNEIFDKKHRMVELEEHIGDFIYNTVYVALTKPETSDFMGVMSIPFFNSEYQMEQKKIGALSIIINVFAIAFIMLLVGSFFVTKSLTSPLKIIANKLRKVETGNKNEPLIWNSNDELGLLINEYNLMLQKIEDSKKALAQTEKEQAWKDMAKQVAHEIKNPLTPMKLKLQHLKRVLGAEDERTSESIDSLLDQIDTLNDIATSFSSFAKMPTPAIALFDISEVCKHVSSLYENNKDYDIVSNIDDNIFVNGDDKLVGRILTNLVLNGIQSVASDIRPLINVDLNIVNDKVMLCVKDNGTGIPLEIQNKVFIPNFTTKYTGSGIGLAVAKNGIEQMGGQIWFETEEDKGTTFFIELSKA